MADGTYNRWDLIFKGLGALGLILTAAIGVTEYWANANASIALETSKLDTDQHKLYFDKQLEYYLNVSETVATIATTSNKVERASAIEKFERLYFGPMVILEDRGDSAQSATVQPGQKYARDTNVERHMVAIQKCIVTGCERRELQNESLALADACRFSLSLTWKQRVENLQRGLNLKERLGGHASNMSSDEGEGRKGSK